MKTYEYEDLKTRKCHGTCLYQANLVDYYRAKECEENCQLVKCPNYLFCRTTGPEWWFGCHHGRCLNCNMFFGKTLKMIEKIQECPVCLDEKEYFAQWGCPHFICLDCFRKMHDFEVQIKDGELVSEPCKESEEETEEEDFDENNESEEKYIPPPENLKICPICRHKEAPHWMKK